MPSVTAKGYLLCIWDIYLQRVLVRRTIFRYIKITKIYWDFSVLYINEFPILQLIVLH